MRLLSLELVTGKPSAGERIKMRCDKCKKEISDKAYINVKGYIVVNDDDANPSVIFSADTHKYYNEELNLHDSCYIQMLIDFGKTELRHP